MDLAGAYPAGCVHSYERAVCFEKGRRIVLEDRAEGLPAGASFELSLMTCEKPHPVRLSEKEAPAGAWEIRLGDVGSFRLEGAADVGCEEIPIRDARLGEMWQHSVYRLRICPKENRLRLIVAAAV